MRFLFFVLLLWATPALADWQYTKWGMTPDEVVAASGGTVHRVARQSGAQDTEVEVEGSYVAAGVEFEVKFLFVGDGSGLAVVELTSKAPMKCYDLKRPLDERYGPALGARISNGAMYDWQDAADGTSVSLADGHAVSPPMCVLSYQRRADRKSAL
ncbi:hypothetical protein DMC47_10000 [Nostoc sp. 3335mG]|nr:hypothetical protein DMC47_10000 [Nostoc sp. 3335mG]